MNKYLCSDGSKVSQGIIESRMRKSKAELIQIQVENHGYNHCTKCGKSSGTRLDCSHIISIREAKNIGKAELCWDVKNMRILCRDCHQIVDRLNLKFNSLIG